MSVVFFLVLIMAASIAVAIFVPAPNNPASFSLNSAWVFRGEVLVGVFFFAYIILTVSITTIRKGRPPKKLGFGLLAFEGEEIKQTVEALEGSEAVLDVMQERMNTVEEYMNTSQRAIKTLCHVIDENISPELSEQASEEVHLAVQEQAAVIEKYESEQPAQEVQQALNNFHLSMNKLREVMKD